MEFPGENISLNGLWLFRFDSDSPSAWREVRVPHTWQVEPDHVAYRGLAWYRRSFDAPQAWRDRAVRVEFEAVFHTATVWVNGKEAGRHIGKGYTAFTLDIGHLLPLRRAEPPCGESGQRLRRVHAAARALQRLGARWRHLPSRAPAGHAAGFHRERGCRCRARSRCRNRFRRCVVVVRNTSQQAWRGNVSYRIVRKSGESGAPSASACLAAGETRTITLPAATLTEPRPLALRSSQPVPSHRRTSRTVTRSTPPSAFGKSKSATPLSTSMARR